MCCPFIFIFQFYQFKHIVFRSIFPFESIFYYKMKKVLRALLILNSEYSFSFLVSFLVDARGGAMRGCRHSGIRIIVPPRSAAQPTRITCRYVKPQRTLHPPQLMESEALASRVLELGPVAAKFIGPVIMEVPHFASLRGKEREIVILRSDNGETWREHQVENSEEIIHDILNEYFEPEGIYNNIGVLRFDKFTNDEYFLPFRY